MIKVADTLAGEKYGLSELTLMKNAARACFDEIYKEISTKDKIVILCGKGNNGGDGYELARILKKEWFDVCCINVFGEAPCTQTAKTVYESCKNDGVEIFAIDRAQELTANANVIIDAVFGVGFKGSIEGTSDLGYLIELCNEKEAKRIAIDVPSGVDSGNASVMGIAFCAHLTLTLAFYKTGTLTYPAKEYCGEIRLLKIGFPKELEDDIPKDALIPDDEYLKSAIPKRLSNTHKGTYGRLLMFCASEFMTGAGVLAAKAALRCGTGLVQIARNKETLKILQQHLIEPVFTPCDVSAEDGIELLLKESQRATAVLTGCGLGTDENDKRAVFSLIKDCPSPLIIDADGINALSSNILILKEAKRTAILTPHPLEFSRLIGKSVSEVQDNRISLARSFAKEYGAVLVLKGARTVIAGPDGRLAICTNGGPGLAKGGSGDVLAGVISAFRALGMSAFDSAVCGVYLHARAGDILTDRISASGFLPSDLPLAIGRLLP